MNDLNDFIPYEETNAWTLRSAQGINDSGAIVGTGLMNGSTHAYLALPAWVIGQPISPPLGAVVQAPSATAIGGSITAKQAFFWNQPPTATSTPLHPAPPKSNGPPPFLIRLNPTEYHPVDPHRQQERLAAPGANARRRRSGAGRAARLAPRRTLRLQLSIRLYSTSLSALVDANSVFTCQTNAYSVLHYLVTTPGETPDAAPFAECFPSRPFRRLE